MLISALRFIYLGWIENQYTEPIFHFTYYGFSWISPLSVWGMYLVFWGMVLSAISITLGFFYRYSSIVFFFLFTYVELLDKTYYLNHYYFVSLVSLLMILVPAAADFSLDAYFNPSKKRNLVPRWTWGIFRLQIGIVYVYAGLAKINYDWLVKALPLKIWLPAQDKLWLIGPLFRLKAMPYLFSWTGMIYDISIPFFLLWSKTRGFAYLAVIGFHVMTGMMFQIGVFPLVMICFTIIYFPISFHEKVLNALRKFFAAFDTGLHKVKDSPVLSFRMSPFRNKLLRGFLLLYFLIQFLFPWRYLLYPGNLFWTEEGYRFSWRVMLMEKAGTATFYVKDGDQGREGVVVNREFLNAHQEKQMSMQPDMIVQFAHYLGAYYRSKGMKDPQVRAEVYVTLNARPSRLLIDPQVNLLEKANTWQAKDWILPIEHPRGMEEVLKK